MVDLRKSRWGKNFLDGEIAEARRAGRLLTLELETSHVCNLRCIYCYNSSGARHHNELTLDEIRDAIEQGLELGLRRVIIIGGGEPMMHPQIMDVLDGLRSKELGIDLFTNGTLIDDSVAEALLARRVEPVVKLNSLDAATQDYLADTEGAFESIMRGLESLRRAGYPNAELDMGIESIICSTNYRELPAMWRWARDRGIIPYFEMITFQGRAKERQDLNVSVEDLRRLFENLARIDREEYGHDWQPHPPIAALSCSRHEYSCTITSRGYVQPCTGVDIKVGNIRHARLKDILAGSAVIQSLRDVRGGIKGACGACDLKTVCYGCRGMAYHYLGDYLGPDPLCWRNPDHIRGDRHEP